MKKKILVVDDSAVIRRYLVKLFEQNGYDVDAVKNGKEALERLRQEHYALVTLDYEMPELNGIDTLKEIMHCCPTRVVMISSFTTESADITFEALDLGALDYVPKPTNSIDIPKISEEILKKVKNILLVPRSKLGVKEESVALSRSEMVGSDVEMGFVLVGSSTGGPRLIERICKSLPADYPHAVCVVQHMPTDFTANFARRLNSLSKVEVLEADNDIALKSGRVIIAKGGWHLHFRRKLKEFKVKLAPNTANRFFVPSVDEMFFSAAKVLPANKILAVELTGIGDDGADGMIELRKKGAYTIAESEKSAIVYGMPKEAYERGGAQKVLDFDEILEEILRYGKK